VRSFRFCSSFLLLALTLACGSSTEPKQTSLDGTWVAAVESASPSGWYQRTLTFDPNGSFVAGFRIYGIYSWQPSNELSGYQRIEGSYDVDGDRLVFHAARLVWWDRYYGAQSPEQVSEPYPYGTIFDDAHYQLQGDELTLHFTTYPADAPEPTVLVFTRVP
jgi:hypothetical protein